MCCLKTAQQSFSMPTVPGKRSQAHFNRKPRPYCKETKKRPRNSSTRASRSKHSQLSKSGNIYWGLDWRIFWRILRQVFFLSGGFRSGFYAADFSNGSHDLNLSTQEFHREIPSSCGAILQACRGQVLLLVLNWAWPPAILFPN